MPRPIGTPIHGTRQGYEFEQRHKIPTCKACREAARSHQYEWKKQNPEASKAINKKSKQKNRQKAKISEKAYRVANKDSLAEANQSWYRANAEHAANKRLLNRYKISLIEYESMLAQQSHACAICGQKDSATQGKRFSVDHDRECCSGYKSCGKCVRGLLCTRCNTAIGSFKDNIDYMLKAIEYVKSFRTGP